MIIKLQLVDPERLGKEGIPRGDAGISLGGGRRINFKGRMGADGDGTRGGSAKGILGGIIIIILKMSFRRLLCLFCSFHTPCGSNSA